jgi:hypothetical protein
MRGTKLEYATRGVVLAVASLVAFAVGCDTYDHCCDGGWECDEQAPAVPTGVGSITGDTYVVVYWNPVYEDDVEGYGIYRSRDEYGAYARIGEVEAGEATEFWDYELVNGTTYYYAVDAFDWAGNSSELSYETVDDTPRPEGWDLVWYERHYSPGESGLAILPNQYDSPVVVPYNHSSANFYLSYDDGGCMRIVPAPEAVEFANLIQDFGYTGSPDDVDQAPTVGWSACPEGVEVILGHSYVFKTSTGYYGKLRVEEIGSEGIIVYWAFQGKRGSTELAPAMGAGPKRG